MHVGPAAEDALARGVGGWDARSRRTLAVVVGAGLLLRCVCVQGVTYLDSLNYAESAVRIAQEGLGPSLGFHQANRLGMTVPPSLFVRLLGPSEAAALAWFFLLSVAELALVPLLLARILRPATTLVAAALLAFAPYAVRAATTNYADAAMATWTNFAMLALLTSPPGGSARRCLVAGALAGVGVLHKETAVFVLPVAAAHALLAGDGGRARWGRVLSLGAGFAAVLAVELATFAATTGDALYRWRHMQETHGDAIGRVERDLADTFLLYWPSNLVQTPQAFGLAFFLLPAALLRTFADRAARRADAWLLAWFLFPALYTVFGTSSLSSWQPLFPYPRYLAFTILPACLLAARYLADRPPRGPALRTLCVVATLAVAAAAWTREQRGWESVTAAAAAVVAVGAVEFAPRRSPWLLGAVLTAPALALVAARWAGEDRRWNLPAKRALAAAADAGARRVLTPYPHPQMLSVLGRLREAPPLDVRRLDRPPLPDVLPTDALVLPLGPGEDPARWGLDPERWTEIGRFEAHRRRPGEGMRLLVPRRE